MHSTQVIFNEKTVCQIYSFTEMNTQGSAGIPAEPGYRPVFDVFVPVPVPAGITILAGILAGIFYQKIGSFH